MPLISFVVPCFNSAEYMSRCIDSLLPGGEDVEIIIVDDGSTDNTSFIADHYCDEHPDIIRVIHKENGGHGSAVNVGLDMAEGIYFKVVDSDDWLERDGYSALLNQIRIMKDAENEPDLFVCDYHYNHLNEGKKYKVSFKAELPVKRVFTWQDIRHFKQSKNLIMHAMIYKTQILKDVGLTLPEHTFFVDNIVAYQPLPHIKSIYYLDVSLYEYFIGREDQSIHAEMMMKRIDQQISITEFIAFGVDLQEVRKTNPKLAVYMQHYVSTMMMVTCVHLLKIGDKSAYRKNRYLWNEFRVKTPELYRFLRYHTMCGAFCYTNHVWRRIVLGGYRLARYIYQFQ